MTTQRPRAGSQAETIRALVVAQLGGEPPATAVVVGNAPLTPSADRAALIDSAGLVRRMTTFALDEPGTPAPAVGRRTDVVIIHRGTRAGPDTFRHHRERTYLLAEPGRRAWEPEAQPAWWPPDLALLPVSNQEFTEPLRAMLQMGARAIAWPTTGTLAVHLVHGLFPEARVRFTGTSLLGPPNTDGHFDHQWGGPMPITAEHRIAAERALLTRWIRSGWLEVLP